ncbi:hypothetical protein JG687_00008515, partial [Phytophthora cactorum]
CSNSCARRRWRRPTQHDTQIYVHRPTRVAVGGDIGALDQEKLEICLARRFVRGGTRITGVDKFGRSSSCSSKGDLVVPNLCTELMAVTVATRASDGSWQAPVVEDALAARVLDGPQLFVMPGHGLSTSAPIRIGLSFYSTGVRLVS